MKFLIFIVAYYHWRVLVISYWLRGAADSLIACSSAFMNSFLLYSLPLNIETNFALDLLIDRNNVLYMYCKKKLLVKKELRTVDTADQIQMEY